MPKRAVPAALFACAVAVLAGCKETAPAAAAPPPVEVGVVSVTARSVAVVRNLPGRVAPTRIAEVRARVRGLILKRFFEQGSHVNEGDPLYQIDPAPFEAELESAEAEVARGEASLTLARQQSERFQVLLERQASSQAQYETAFATMKGAEATLAGAKATRTRARLNLGYATVRAPIGGRIGRALLTEGALVDEGSTAILATIQQLDPVYVDITQSVGELRRLRRDLASGELARIASDVPTVRVLLEDGVEHPQAGRLLFSDVTADPSTGQVTLRVEVPNPASELFPGMYVRARIEQAIDKDAIAIPQQAVQRDQDGLPQVLIVGPDDAVSTRSVTLGDVIDGLWIVRDGLKAGDRVVVDGFQRMTPGAKVRPVVVDERKLTAVVLPTEAAPSASAGVAAPEATVQPAVAGRP